MVISFLGYIAIYFTYMNFGTSSNFWKTMYFINENLLVINLLFSISLIIKELRLKLFAYIFIFFKLIICVIDGFSYAGFVIKGEWPELIIAIFWIFSLLFYLYVSNKGLRQQKMD